MPKNYAPPETLFYLHGWTSGPNSFKARLLRDYFAQHHRPLIIPDLNQNDFFHLSLTRQIQQVTTLLPPRQPVTLIGSSLGALTALWLAEQHPQIQRLFLLSPAIDFLTNSLALLGEQQLINWYQQGQATFYHHALQRDVPLSYLFIQDMYSYNDQDLRRQLPTFILHGIHDTIIPVHSIQNFIFSRPWINLTLLDTDHNLTGMETTLCQKLQLFLDN